jgi:hypothetical protein
MMKGMHYRLEGAYLAYSKQHEMERADTKTLVKVITHPLELPHRAVELPPSIFFEGFLCCDDLATACEILDRLLV